MEGPLWQSMVGLQLRSHLGSSLLSSLHRRGGPNRGTRRVSHRTARGSDRTLTCSTRRHRSCGCLARTGQVAACRAREAVAVAAISSAAVVVVMT